MRKILIIFILGLIVGGGFRFYRLGSIPGGFFRDEAALAYNAYRIWTTGTDEYGISYPPVFRSFEVFFLPTYVYLSVPVMGLLGLNEFSGRLISALAGTITVVVLGLIAGKLWGKKAGIAGLVVAVISPWAIYYSRGAFEGNLGVMFFSIMVLSWFNFVKNKKPAWMVLSGLFSILAMYSYQAERLVVPVWGLVAIWLVRKIIWENRKTALISVIAGIILLVPLLKLTLSPAGYFRATGVSIWKQNRPPPGWVEGKNNFWYLRIRQVLALYLAYYSPRNLFFDNDYNKQRAAENYSVFYAWMMIPLAIGVWSLRKPKNNGEKLLWVWLLAGPLPATATADPFHTYRALLVFPVIGLFISRGLGVIWEKLGKLGILVTTLIALVSVAGFWLDYATITQAVRANEWDYGYKRVFEVVRSHPEIDRWVIDDPTTAAYVQTLMFAPEYRVGYAREIGKIVNKNNYYSDPQVLRVFAWDNLEIRTISWYNIDTTGKTGYVAHSSRLVDGELQTIPGAQLIEQINYPSGKAAFRILNVVR